MPKLHDLSRRIAELTEELKSEKEVLLHTLDCTGDADVSDVKKEISTMETLLQKLEEQEARYSTELDDALKQYGELKKQAAGMDAAELMDARVGIRPDMECAVIERAKVAYGEKYASMMMYDSKQDVANLLHEEMEARSVREFLCQKPQTQPQQKKPRHHEQER